jgi:hypothetical protein
LGNIHDAANYPKRFVKFPSQAGFFYQWGYSTTNDAPRPYPPTGTALSPLWSGNPGNVSMKYSLDTVCPPGYTSLPRGNDATSPINLLLAAPSVWGYYADGFFDRRPIVSSAGNVAGSAVSTPGNEVAYRGRLFYHNSTNASLFFPASGYRSDAAGSLSSTGDNGYWWSSSFGGAGNAWSMGVNKNTGAPSHQSNVNSAHGYSVRCVYAPLPIIYNPDDIAVINKLIANNGLGWTATFPADGTVVDPSWSPGVTWSSVATNKRIVSINFSATTLSGAVNLSPLDELEWLNCSGKNITSLEVTNVGSFEYLDASNCTLLKTLICNNNSLTTLDVDGSTVLETLNCSNNHLPYLDVYSNDLLEYLNCSHNELPYLDFSNNPALKYLDCSCNEITYLDVYNNDLLEHLNCSHNKLEELDVTNNPALEELYLNYNKLTKLKIENLTELKKLEFNYNLVSEATVWGCIKLEWIYAKFNRILDSNDMEAFLTSLPDRTGLEEGKIFLEGNLWVWSQDTRDKNWDLNY